MTEKLHIRKKIATLKKSFSKEELKAFSEEVIDSLVALDEFQKATCIFCYYSLPDEVDTHALIEKYAQEKKFILPVIHGDELLLREYQPNDTMNASSFGILEPEGTNFTQYKAIDLVIVPGVAFDTQKNRLGRGKGYYDRILSKIKAKKVGICFDFQLLGNVPTETFDIPMDKVVTQNEILF